MGPLMPGPKCPYFFSVNLLQPPKSKTEKTENRETGTAAN